MTISYNDRSITYNVTASTTGPFLADFPVYSNDSIKVFVGEQETTSFTVAATYVDGRSDDAAITLLSAVSNVNVKIVGFTRPERSDNLPAGGQGLVDAVEHQMDVLTASVQEALRSAEDALKGGAAWEAVIGDSDLTHTFPTNKQLVLVSDTPTGTIGYNILFEAGNEFSRPGIGWRDELGRKVASLTAHSVNHADGNVHNAVELKTAGADFSSMSTIISVSWGADARDVDFNDIDRVNFLRADPLEPDSAHRIFVRLNATGSDIEVNPNDNVEGVISFSGERFQVRYDGSAWGEVRAGSGKGIKLVVDDGIEAIIINNAGRVKAQGPFARQDMTRAQVSGLSPTTHDSYMLTDASAADIAFYGPVNLAASGSARVPIYYDGAVWRYG